MVPPLLGCTGILNAMQSFMQVFPYSAIPPRIFPAYPRSLASVLIPRPAARRDSAFSAFRKSFRQDRKSAERKDFPNLPKMRRLAHIMKGCPTPYVQEE
jgi:hypothetical protein